MGFVENNANGRAVPWHLEHVGLVSEHICRRANVETRESAAAVGMKHLEAWLPTELQPHAVFTASYSIKHWHCRTYERLWRGGMFFLDMVLLLIAHPHHSSPTSCCFLPLFLYCHERLHKNRAILSVILHTFHFQAPCNAFVFTVHS